MRIGIVFRYLLAVYCLLLFSLPFLFKQIPFGSPGVSLLTGAALVFYIVSLGGLLIAHKTEGRPSWELSAVPIYPFAVYVLMYQSSDFGSRDFWTFNGVFTFLMIAGGFALGIFLSPLIARFRGQSFEGIEGKVRAGFRQIWRTVPIDFAVLFLGGSVLALALSGANLFPGIMPPGFVPRLTGFLFLAAGMTAVAVFAYRHTFFGLRENRKLRDRYRRHPGES